MNKGREVGLELRKLSILIKRDRDIHKEMRCGHEGSKPLSDNEDIQDLERPTHMQMMIMGYLIENMDKDIYQKDLEKNFSIRRPTATNMLKRMENQGLIIRESVPGDARLKKIVLTKKALDFSKMMDENIKEFEQRLTKGLTENEINVLLTAIKKMKKNLEEQ